MGLGLFFLLCLSSVGIANPKEDTVVAASKDTTAPHIIGTISSESSDKMSFVTIRLDRAPSFKKLYLEDHGSFLQIAFPQTIIAKPGEFVDGHGPYVAKVAAYQFSNDKSIVRIFLNQEASLVKQVSEVEILDSRVVFSLDHNALLPLLPKTQAEKPQSLDTTKPTSQSTTVTTVRGNKPYESYLVWIAGLLAVMSALTLIVLTFKRFARNQFLSYNGDQIVKMKAISHLSLAPRQKLSLVQIGPEKLLMSVSPDGISFLTKIEANPAPIPQVKQSLSVDQIRQRAKVIQQQAQGALNEKKQVKKRLMQKQQPTDQAAADISPKEEVKPVTQPSPNPYTEKDVTQLIRDKLKSLPKL